MNESPTYQELLAANRQLVAENELLRKENAKLSRQVKSIAEVGEDSKNIEVTSGNKSAVIIATEKYVGEGFDCPRLDTLFLALPVSWKGIVAQYAGRLHRDYPGKEIVQVYDYIGIHFSMCDVMYKRRLKGYASVGYKIQQNDLKDLFGINQDVIFTGKSYQSSFFVTTHVSLLLIISSISTLLLRGRGELRYY